MDCWGSCLKEDSDMFKKYSTEAGRYLIPKMKQMIPSSHSVCKGLKRERTKRTNIPLCM